MTDPANPQLIHLVYEADPGVDFGSTTHCSGYAGTPVGAHNFIAMADSSDGGSTWTNFRYLATCSTLANSPGSGGNCVNLSTPDLVCVPTCSSTIGANNTFALYFSVNDGQAQIPHFEWWMTTNVSALSYATGGSSQQDLTVKDSSGYPLSNTWSAGIGRAAFTWGMTPATQDGHFYMVFETFNGADTCLTSGTGSNGLPIADHIMVAQSQGSTIQGPYTAVDPKHYNAQGQYVNDFPVNTYTCSGPDMPSFYFDGSNYHIISTSDVRGLAANRPSGYQCPYTDGQGYCNYFTLLDWSFPPNSPSSIIGPWQVSYVFWNGPDDNNLYQAQGSPSGQLSGPYPLGMYNLDSSPTATIDSGNNTYVYWRGTDGNLWEGYWNGSQWVGPYNRGMGPLGSPPSAVIGQNGTAYIFWRGADGQLYQARGAPSGGLSGPYPLGMYNLGSTPTASINSSNATFVYWEGADRGLWEAYWNGSQWVGPYNRGMGPLGSPPSAVIGPYGTDYVFWRGTDYHLWQALGNPTGALSGPWPLGMGILGSPPTASINNSNATFVYWDGTDGNLWEGYWNGSQWVGPKYQGMGIGP